MITQRLRMLPALRWPRSPRSIAKVAVWIIGLIVLAEAGRIVLGNNLHEVIPGKVYRCSQPSGPGWESLIDRLGIRTVINLRGYGPDPRNPWYPDETRATLANGVSQEDITLSALRLPPPAELRRLIDVLDHTEYPIIFHCKQGADRTGLVATMVLLLYTDADLARAKQQLWPRYGHVRFGRTAAIDQFFERYEAWLAGREHTPALFRDWVLNHYSPGPARGTLELREGRSEHVPQPVARDQWFALPVRANNHSSEPWVFKPGNFSGIHVAYSIRNSKETEVYKGQAGLFHATVPPGESIDLTFAIPPLKEPGTYVLKADLMDATGAAVPIRTTTFYQFGNDPLMVHLNVQ